MILKHKDDFHVYLDHDFWMADNIDAVSLVSLTEDEFNFICERTMDFDSFNKFLKPLYLRGIKINQPSHAHLNTSFKKEES
jgi:hypothetical protein